MGVQSLGDIVFERQQQRAVRKRIWNEAIEAAAYRLETANDETSRKCLIDALRDMKLDDNFVKYG